MQTLEEIDFKEGELVLSVRVEPQSETVWLNRQQMAQLFDRDVKTIGKHIQAALREELEDSVVAKFATTASDVIAECPPERIVVERAFRACPKSLEKLRSQISAYSGLYVLSNFQCDTWCDEMLRKAGADIPHVPGALFATPGVGCGAPVSKEFDSPAERKTNMDINIFKTSIPF